MSHHERLGLTAAAFEDLRPHFETRTYGDLEYRALPRYRSQLEKGTVLVGETAVRGFPKVPRTLVLETGLPRHFETAFVAEEKLDGYNVRVARIDGEILAFTRSGIVCPFSTHLLTERFDLPLAAFFEDHPTRMLCGEMVGPENPYTTHAYPGVESLAFRAFDVRDRERGTPMALERRREVCADYDIPQVPRVGTFDPADAEALRSALRTLDEEGREGVVMKSKDGATQLKYTTSAANRGDLAFAFSVPFDYGQDFMFRRLIREAFQSVEWDEGEAARTARAHELGEAILQSMVDAIETVDAGGTVGERHTVRADPAAVSALLDHLDSLGLTIRVESDRMEDGDRVVTFLKELRSSTDKTRSYLDGHIVRE